MERIRYKGKSATAGACRGCALVLIVTDKEPNGDFQTYHEHPMCEWYLDRCKAAESIGEAEMTKENTEFIK